MTGFLEYQYPGFQEGENMTNNKIFMFIYNFSLYSTTRL